jgi:NADH:ubiquinone oxidoreductase subunit 3 (subunit A)
MTNAMPSRLFFALKLSIVLTILMNFPNSNALKHSFVANHDGRFFIGPIGVPYGFLKKGIYYLRVSQFRINTSSHNTGHSSKHDKNNPMSDKDINSEMDGLHPGFLLKRFDNEAMFATFQEMILEDPTKCGFDGLEDEIDQHSFEDQGTPQSITSNNDGGISGTNDDLVATGRGVFDGGADGIFMSMKHPKQWKPNEPTVHNTFTVNEEGYYFLFYQICLTENTQNQKYLFKEMKSSFKLDFEYMNYDVIGNASYLTAGEMPLPHMYLYFSISYAIMLLFWLRRLQGEGFGFGHKPTVYAIHHLMSAVLLLKVLSIFFESVRYHFIRVNGHAELWVSLLNTWMCGYDECIIHCADTFIIRTQSIVYYGLNFVKGTFLFTVILLIGSGWSFFKPLLTQKERRIIYFVFFLQVVDNIAILVLTHETMGERLYNDWSAVLHLVDIFSCCAILVPIVWQVNSLEESLESVQKEEAESEDENENGIGGSTATGETLRLQSTLSLFRSFYLIVVAYIYFTRIVVYLFATSLSYNNTWMRYFVAEVGTLLFYLMIGIKFMPTVRSEYEQVVSNEPNSSEENTIELGSMS